MTWLYVQPMGDAETLCAEGPIVLAELVPNDLSRANLDALGVPWKRKRVRLLVDTGAAMSMLDDDAAQGIGLDVSRYVSVAGVAPMAMRCPVYHAELEMGFERKHHRGRESCIMNVPVSFAGMPSARDRMGYVGLLGRDFLEHFEMAYDGPGGKFALGSAREWARRSKHR